MSDEKEMVPTGITESKTIGPQGFWPDLTGENPCGEMVLINGDQKPIYTYNQ